MKLSPYNNINSLGMEHRTVNHSLYFVDPNTGVHTQNIESLWNQVKYKFKKMKGVKREFLQLYLNEFMPSSLCIIFCLPF